MHYDVNKKKGCIVTEMMENNGANRCHLYKKSAITQKHIIDQNKGRLFLPKII